MAGGKSQRRVATVLFVDVVDSTRVASEVGDRRWRELVGAFRATVRRQLKRFGGHEVDTAGDGFFTWFDSPANAIRAAAAITGDVQALGLDVRCGLHTGELEQIDGRPGGIAAHIGARVMAAAGPAEILATSTVRDLVVGGDVTFEPFGEVELKGVPGRWTLLRITAVAGQPLVKPLVAGDAAQRRAATSPAVAGRRRLIWASLGVIALVLLAGAAWGTGLFGANPTASPSPSPTLIVRASPTTAPTQGASASPSLSPTPTPPVALVQIDPITNRVVEQVPDVNAKAGQSFLEIASGSLWQFYGDYRLLYLRDLETGEFIKSTQLPNDVWTVQRGFGSIWVAHGDPFTLIDRIDPTSLVTTQKDILPGLRLWDMAVADRAVYLLDSEHVLQELDPVTNKIVGTFDSGSDSSQDLRFHDGLLELGINDGAGQGYLFIDPVTHLVVPRPSIPAIWELNFDTSTVNTYDPATDTRGDSIGTRDPPQDVATGFGSAWIAAGSIVYRMDEQRIAAQIPMPEGIYAMSIAIDEPSQTVWVANCFGGIGRC